MFDPTIVKFFVVGFLSLSAAVALAAACYILYTIRKDKGSDKET
jgi:hypothetical protein